MLNSDQIVCFITNSNRVVSYTNAKITIIFEKGNCTSIQLILLQKYDNAIMSSMRTYLSEICCF